jgi:hypothetical protein
MGRWFESSHPDHSTELREPMQVRIFKPSKTAMQSGKANTREWRMEFEPASPRRLDPLMGWTSSDDTAQQVALSFETKEQAIAYAEAHGYAHTVEEEQARRVTKRAYADNFRYDRVLR